MDTQTGHDHLTLIKGTWPIAATAEKRKIHFLVPSLPTLM